MWDAVVGVVEVAQDLGGGDVADPLGAGDGGDDGDDEVGVAVGVDPAREAGDGAVVVAVEVDQGGGGELLVLRKIWLQQQGLVEVEALREGDEGEAEVADRAGEVVGEAEQVAGVIEVGDGRLDERGREVVVGEDWVGVGHPGEAQAAVVGGLADEVAGVRVGAVVAAVGREVDEQELAGGEAAGELL